MKRDIEVRQVAFAGIGWIVGGVAAVALGMFGRIKVTGFVYTGIVACLLGLGPVFLRRRIMEVRIRMAQHKL